MPPPAVPMSSQIPNVQLLPPTPNTSQEESRPTTLLAVPQASIDQTHQRTRSRSRTPDPSEPQRRSPRLSPVPKRPASDSLDEPKAKKPRK